LQYQLTDDCLSNDNKEMIMDYFIKKLEEENLILSPINTTKKHPIFNKIQKNEISE